MQYAPQDTFSNMAITESSSCIVGLTGQPEKRLEDGEGRRRGGGRGRRVEGGMGRVLLPQTPEARGLGGFCAISDMQL